MVYFSSYIPFYAWIAAPLFKLLKKGQEWQWDDIHQEAFELCKQGLVQAPVRAHAMPGRPYRVYSDACDYGLAAILQQVQPIQIRDLQGTRIYERLRRAYLGKEPVPRLVAQISKDFNDVPPPGSWAESFEDTEVYVEQVVAYWSRILKTAERNYSPTEREALALREGPIKFQPYIEGEKILAVTDHAALTWSRTYQNINRRLQTWGTTFAAYPDLKIVHRAGRVHSNVDPISRLRRRVPYQEGPVSTPDVTLSIGEQVNDPLKNAYDELGPQFEERLLTLAQDHSSDISSRDEDVSVDVSVQVIPPESDLEFSNSISYHAAATASLIIGISQEEHQTWLSNYDSDSHFKKVLQSLRKEDANEDSEDFPVFPQYHLGEDGLIYFEDWNGADRLCVPESQKLDVIKEGHDLIVEGSHAGYHRTYNRITSTYYWPRMSRDIKKYVTTCDICQKAKPRCHAPVGLLNPIAIPSQPFEVVTMDFIPELPSSNGYDNCLVIVDKLTKYGMFIPTTTKITAEETAKLFFHHVVSHYGLPQQVITDRDSRWSGTFWGELCELMGIRRALTTAHHPQSDGQSEILNQTLEIALRAYVSAARDDWSEHLDPLMLSYNSTLHTATGFAPAYLLRGYVPITPATIIHSPAPNERPNPRRVARGGKQGKKDRAVDDSTDKQLAEEMSEHFAADRHKAQQALVLGQHAQRRIYNKGRLNMTFEPGDLVLINPHSLELLRKETGRGKKLLMKYDGPFEIMHKVSPVAYRLRLPASYQMHPILNIAHLERYNASPPEYGYRPNRRLHRADFQDMPEIEVERIIAETWRKGKKGKHVKYYKVRFVGMGPEEDEWKTKQGLRNAPDLLIDWEMNVRKVNHYQEQQDRSDTFNVSEQTSEMNDKHNGTLKPRGKPENHPTQAILTRPHLVPHREVTRRSQRVLEKSSRFCNSLDERST